jgi:hypothetical protein
MGIIQVYNNVIGYSCSATDKEKVDELKQFLKMWIDSQGESVKLYIKA